MSENTTPLLTTGASGLVGSVFVRDFAHSYQITNLDLSGTPSVDITNGEQIETIIAAHPAQWIVHCAAFTDVTAAWQQTGDTTGIAYQVNVVGTENLVNACKKHQKKILFLSTAYVFSGDKSAPYTETDQTEPIEWYGETKRIAEERIAAAGDDWVILRIDNPFRRDRFPKPDIVRRILDKLETGTLPPQFADAYFGPTVIEDVARVIDWVIRTDARGCYHATANEAWTQHTFAQAVASRAGYDPSTIRAGSLSTYLESAERPYPRNTALDCTKLIGSLDFKLQTVAEALENITI